MNDRFKARPAIVSRRDWITAAFLAVASLTLYLFLPAGWLHCDTIPIAADLPGTWKPFLGIHPHHLLTFPLAKTGYYVAYSILLLFNPEGELAPLIWLQLVSRFSGALCVGLTYVTIRKLYPQSPYALPTTIACTFAYSFLHFSLDGCRYLPTLFWIWLTYFLLPWHPAPLKEYIPSICAFVFSVLMHQLAIFTILALVVHSICFTESESPSSRERIRYGVKIGLISAIAVFIPYALIGGYASWAYFNLSEQTEYFKPESFLDMLLYYGTHGETYWAEDIYSGFLEDALAFLPLWIPRHQTYLGLHVPLSTLAALGPAIISIWTALNFRRMPVNIRYAVLVTLSVMLLYFLFQIWYAPWFYFFKLFIFMPLLIFMVSGLETIRETRSGKVTNFVQALYWLWVLLLIWVNMSGLKHEWEIAGIPGPF